MKTRRNPTLVLSPNGFTIHERKKSDLAVEWNLITKIVAYKVDEWSTDLVCFDLWAGGNPFVTIHEDMPGFIEVTDAMAGVFQGYLASWRQDVILPPFERNETLVWEREK